MAASGRLTNRRPSADPETAHRVRPCVAEDLPYVAALRRRSFKAGQRHDHAGLVAYFERVFLRNPWRDPELPSLIYEDEAGNIAGFIGVIPRRMTFRDEPLRVAVATQMMVAPESRGLAGRQLVRALLDGPQDLTLSDTANDAARRVWKSVGADDALLYGFEWERVLRPLAHARSRLASSPLFVRAAGFVARPMLAAIDSTVARLSSLVIRPPGGSLEPLDASVIAAAAAELLHESALRPAFDPESLRWLLSEAAQKRELGTLAGGIVRAPDRSMVGWFVHYVTPRGMSHVLQIAARRATLGLVVNHLLRDAWVRDAVAVVGRLEASLLPAVEGPMFRYRRQPPWTLVHSRRPELLHAIESGDAFISRLDGEWWLSF